MNQYAPSCHDTDDPTNSSDLDDDEQVEENQLEDDTDYGDEVSRW